LNYYNSVVRCDYRITEDLCCEKLQLLQNKKNHYENQRDKIKQQIASMDEKPDGIQNELGELEKEIYNWQIKILDIQQDMLEQEEEQTKAVISTMTSQMSCRFLSLV
jgi:septal ring factor EnvC (AmiA/AmiB activator)